MNGLAMKVEVTRVYELPGFGEKMKSARKALKDAGKIKNAGDLANKAGMTEGNWYKIEGEKFKKVPKETCLKIKEAIEAFGGLLDVELPD